jgi:hypothetical protein
MKMTLKTFFAYFCIGIDGSSYSRSINMEADCLVEEFEDREEDQSKFQNK